MRLGIVFVTNCVESTNVPERNLPLGTAQKLFHSGRRNRVVPLREDFGSGDLQFFQSCRRGFQLERVVLAVQVGADFEARGRDGIADEFEDFVVGGERFGGPVSGDLTEQTAFHGVVLGGASRIVGQVPARNTLKIVSTPELSMASLRRASASSGRPRLAVPDTP